MGAGSIPSKDNSIVLAALYQRMEMTLVKYIHNGGPDAMVLHTDEKRVIFIRTI
jgi:hypothetical protein